MSIQDSTIICGYPLAHRMLTFGYPTQINEIHNERVAENIFNGITLAKDQYTSGDLVSLSWLQKGNILQITPLDSEEDGSRESRMHKMQALEDGSYAHGYAICEPQVTLSSVGSSLSSRISLGSTGCSVLPSSYVSGPNYSNPYCVGLSKPCYSYTHLIFMAIESTPSKCMTVNQIYNWCETNFPFYKHAGAGWKNSLRHNLSINKSFKRLPRDGRTGIYENVFSWKLALYYDATLIYDESEETDEGPGRGAYWAVEPRERPNLMDAVKRNPWNVNVARERALVQPLNCNHLGETTALGTNHFTTINPHGEVQSTNLTGYSLAQSAPETVLRSAGVGNCNMLLSNSHSGASSPFSLIETSELKMENSIQNVAVQKCVSTLESTQFRQDNAMINQIYMNAPAVENEEFINAFCSTEQIYDSYVYPTWPEEEEEKYRSMLQLMLESSDSTVSCRRYDDINGSYPGQIQSGNVPGDISLQSVTKPKKDYVKQRRKSSLNPTVENMCNECKENEASSCRSCQLRFWQSQHSGSSFEASQTLLKIGKLNSYAADNALEELMEMLDDDQETGPAGGPALAKKIVKLDDSSTTNVDSGEVFITQAPYLDHEYSHCQKHLRRQEENRSVEAYNARYRQDRLHLLRGLAESNANKTVSLQQSGFSISAEESETENSMSIGDEFDSYKRDSSDSDMLPTAYHRPQSSDHVRSRHRLIIEPVPLKDTQLVSRKRGRPGLKTRISQPTGALLSKPSRRSSRTVRAPKRLYDDLEEDDGDEEDEEDKLLEMDTSLETEAAYHEEEEMYEMSRYRLNYPLPYTKHYYRRSRLVPQFLPPVDSRVFESERCRKHRNRQVNISPENVLNKPVVRRRKPYQNDTRMNFKTDNARRSSDLKVRRKERVNTDFLQVEKKSRKHQVQEDDSILRSVDNKQSSTLIKDSNGDKKSIAENTTVEAAQILLGISQMQNFQRQSGYVSLDSSGASMSSSAPSI